MTSDTYQRYEVILSLRREGLTFGQIGEKVGVHGRRASQLDASKNRRIWSARAIEDRAGSLMHDFRLPLAA